MISEDDIEGVRARFEKLAWTMDERMRRLFAAAEASVLGHGGVSEVARAIGVSRRAIHAGMIELSELTLKAAPDHARQRVRRQGGGRKSMRATDAAALTALRLLIEPRAEGEPELPLRWTGKSLRTLAAEMRAAGHPVSFPTVANLLCALGYSLQPNRRLAAGLDHPDRHAQFAFINHQASARLLTGDPVISVDTRKMQRNGARDGADAVPRPPLVDGFDAAPRPSLVDGFNADAACLRPDGVDEPDDGGWSAVPRDHDTASFAVEAIRRWWRTMGRQRFPAASELMITVDGGGGSGRRMRLWKLELQRLADEIGVPIHISHLPPATNRWSRIEHRLSSSVSLLWRGKPPVRHEVTISLVAGTITRKGLKPAAETDDADARAIDAQFEKIHLIRSAFHGDWNYRIDPSAVATRPAPAAAA